MQLLPKKIENVDQLEKLLSEPSEQLIEMMKALDGDLMVLGAGGKVGPTLTRMAKRAVDAAEVEKKVIAVDVSEDALAVFQGEGIETFKCDLLNLKEVEKLPRVKNVVYMVGRKFGSTGQESLTWAINVAVPHHVASTLQGSRIAAFSTGCVYPVMHIKTGGATEATPVDPVGEYAMSCLGRERMFDFYSDAGKEEVVHVRLNYAVELRYGVLYDVATQVFQEQPIDITTGYGNVIWQGDACDQILRSLPLASSPAQILNITGPELFSIRLVAEMFGELMGKKAIFRGEENGMGYLNNATKANTLFGNPRVPLGKIIEWIAQWIMQGGESLGKPTHFETQDGKY